MWPQMARIEMDRDLKKLAKLLKIAQHILCFALPVSLDARGEGGGRGGGLPYKSDRGACQIF